MPRTPPHRPGLRRAAHPERRGRAAAAKSKGERGAALLVAVVSVAILTALAVDLTYQTQVRLRTAANARDELRAQALAQSAVSMSRVMLSFQQQMDNMSSAMCAAQQGAQAATGGASAGCLRLQLWNLVPVGSALTQAIFADGGRVARPTAATPEAAGGAGGAGAVQPAAMADFQGGYEARIEDEGQKFNAQLDGSSTSGLLAMQVEALLRMMCDAKWDPLFDRPQADGERYSRSDLVVNLRDWADDDTTGSGLTASFQGGACSPVVARTPFEKAFSDENVHYDRATGDDRYRVKNARFDSLEELHLVAGVSDAFMAAFQDQLTVYLPRDKGMNVNNRDPRWQIIYALLMADPTAEAKLRDPIVQALFLKALDAATLGGLLSITPTQFAQMEEAAGVKVRREFLTKNDNGPFTDRSLAYRIRAFGVAGDVTHEIDAVVTFDPNQKPIEERTPPGAATPDMGILIHWRED